MSNKINNKLYIVAYLAINILFILKYGLRYFSWSSSVLISIAYICFILLFFYLFKKVNFKVIFLPLVVAFLLLVLLQYYIDPYQLQVDRWSAIHNFLKNLFSGIYPYSAQTHLGGYGSPFPIWQLLHIPFYWLGNVGLSVFITVVVFIDAIRRLFDIKRAVFAFALLVLSPAFVYEVTVRSDLMTNFLLCAGLIMYFVHYKISLDNHFCFLAIFFGLVASTRLSAVIPFGVYFLYDFIRLGFRRQSLLILISLIVFVSTFIPFFLWDGEMLLFFEYNPFVLQSRQGNITDFIVFIPIGIWLSLSWKGSFSKYSFHTALLLILLVVITFIHNMYINNNWYELFESAYDITYFNMSLPFLITALLSQYDRDDQ